MSTDNSENPIDWTALSYKADLAAKVDPDGTMDEAEVEARVSVEMDRQDTILESFKLRDAYMDELEAGAIERAAEMKLFDFTTKDLKHDELLNWVLETATGESAVEWVRGEVIRNARAKAHEAAEFEVPTSPIRTLAEAFKADIPPLQYRIADLALRGGNVTLSAEFKSGKSTLMFSLIKALCDGTPFLGHEVTPLAEGRTVAYWDYELDESYAIGELKKVGIRHPERASALHLRGFTTPLTTDRAKAWAVNALIEAKADVWIIDPFFAMYTGDENSNTEVGATLRAIDEIKRKAGVSECWVVFHTGRGGEDRARGAIRVDDWTDVRWVWKKASGADQRLLKADGRGVQVSEIRAEYIPETCSYKVVEAEDLDGARSDDLATRIVHYVVAHPRCSTRDIHAGVEGSKTRVTDALQRLIESGDVLVDKVGKTYLHTTPKLGNVRGV